MKLIFHYYETDGYSYGEDYFIPFEYESKEKFAFDILEAIKDIKPKNIHLPPYLDLFGFRIYTCVLEKIEEDVFTLEEWFEKNKQKIIL